MADKKINLDVFDEVVSPQQLNETAPQVDLNVFDDTINTLNAPAPQQDTGILQTLQNVGSAIAEDVQKSRISEAASSGAAKLARGVRNVSPLATALTVAGVLDPPKPLPKFTARTGTELLVERAIQESPALIPGGAIAGKVAQRVAPTAGRIAAGAAAGLAGGAAEGALGVGLRLSQEDVIGTQEAIEDVALASLWGTGIGTAGGTFGALFKKRASPIDIAPESPLKEISATPSREALKQNLEKQLSVQASKSKQLATVKSQVRRSLDTVEQAKQKQISTVDDASQKVAEIEDVFESRIANLETTDGVVSRAKIRADQLRSQLQEAENLAEIRQRSLGGILERETFLKPRELKEKRLRKLLAQAEEKLANQKRRRTTQLSLRKQKLQEAQSTRLVIQEQAAKSRYDKAIARALTFSGKDNKFRQLLQEIQSSLEEQVRIKEAMKEFNFTTPQGRLGKGIAADNTLEEVVDRALGQVRKVDKAFKEGLLTETQATALREAEFNNALRVQGINPGMLALDKPGALDKWLNNTTRFNRVQKRVGARTGEAAEAAVSSQNAAINFEKTRLAQVNDMATNLNKLGVTDTDITRLAQYFETTPQGVVFNPAPLKIEGKIDIPAYDGPQLSPEIIQEMSKVRQFLDEMADVGGVEKLPRYIPLRRTVLSTGKEGVSSEAILDAQFRQSRQDGTFNPLVNEDHFRKLMLRYTREISRSSVRGPALQQGIAELNKLRLLGAASDAQDFQKFLVDAFGLNDIKEASQIFAQRVVSLNRDALRQLAQAAPTEASGWRQIYDVASEAMFANFVGTNPKSLLLQVIQPETVATLELGRYVPIGRALAFSPTQAAKRWRAEADDLMRLSLVDDVTLIDEAIDIRPTNIAAKGLKFINLPATTFGRKAMSKIEKANRRVSMLGAFQQFEDAVAKGTDALDKVLSNLTTAERSLIRKTNVEGGLDEARRMYGVIMARRTNFAYNVADRPEMLREGIGRYIPFTTFVRNIANRVIEDVDEKNYTRLARRVLAPTLALALFESMTGKTLPGVTTLAQLPGALTATQPAPFITQPASEFVRTGDPRRSAIAAARAITPAGAFRNITGAFTGEKPILRNVKDRKWMDELFRDFRR